MKLISRPTSFLFFLIPALLAIASIAEILSIPSDPKNTAFLGLSSSRLVLFACLAAGALFFTVLAALFWKYPLQAQAWTAGQLKKKSVFLSLCGASIFILIATYIILAIPDRYLHEYDAIHERAQPILAWLCIVSFQATLGLLAWSIAPKLKTNLDPAVPYRQILKTGITVLAVLLVMWILIGVTKMGVWPGNAFWGKVGVPVLWAQVFLALGASIVIQMAFIARLKLSSQKLWFDVSVCAVIWLAAFLLWSNQPFTPGVFTTPPVPPAFQIYPDNDSLIFDSAAQNLLDGGDFSPAVADKSIYVTFLAILHMLVGSNYSSLYILQVALFAIIPVIGYALGKTLHSRQLGIMFGILLVFREQNAIALTNTIQVSTSKMILSEMLTTLGVMLFTLVLVLWLKNPDPLRPKLWIAGGILGITGLVRLNALTIIPLALLLAGLALKFRLRNWLFASILFVAFVGISILPWSIQSYATTGDPLAFVTGKTGGVIFNNRYTPVIAEEQPKPAPAETQMPPSGQIQNPAPQAKPEDSRLEKYLALGKNITQHYVHNLISMVVMLPPSGSLYELSDMTIRLPYWKLYWDGELQADAYLILLAVLTFVSLGLSTAWTRSQAAGIAPLLIVLGYDISTALALTSGGRYMVPMDWCVLLYFSIGTVEIARWFMGLYNRLPESGYPVTGGKAGKMIVNYTRLTLVSLAFLAIGSLPTLLENLPPRLYPPVSKTDFADAVKTIPEVSNPENRDKISFMMKDPHIQIEHGRALYPRYYPKYSGESNLVHGPVLTNRENFNRLTFLFVGTGTVPVVMPISDEPDNFATDADIWIIGCDRQAGQQAYVEALLIILRKQNTTHVYQQTPFKMTCQ